MSRKTSMGCVKLITLLFLVALGVSFGFTPVAAQDIYPREVEAELHPNESVKIEKTVTTLEIPPLVDICLVEDETGSFADDIANLQALAPDLVEALDASGSNYATCVIGFRDFDQSFWGSPGDWVYRRLADVGVGGGPLLAGVGLLTGSGGADGPEAQLEALHYLADPGHAAIDSNGDGDTIDANDTAAGLQPTWRAGATRIVLLATDASCHVTGDAGGWPGDAGTSSPAATATVLASAGITVIGLTPGGAGTIACVDTLAGNTGGSVQATTASGEDVVGAILAGLGNLPVDVAMATDCEAPIEVSFEPPDQTVTSGEDAIFTETIEVANDALPGIYECRDWALVDGEPLIDPDTGEIIYETKTITVLDGRMTGGGSVFTQDGDRVTHGFELHCASIMEPNNLQVNWGKGNKFHLESLDRAKCSDHPKRDESPPVAGFDTFRGKGTGRYNGESGAKIWFFFTDDGEPGKNDVARIRINDAGGNTVLDVAGKLKNGNHQAHEN